MTYFPVIVPKRDAVSAHFFSPRKWRVCSGAKVPLHRQGEHDGQKALRFQAEPLISQMMIEHDGVVTAFLHSHDCHDNTSFRLSLVLSLVIELGYAEKQI